MFLFPRTLCLTLAELAVMQGGRAEIFRILYLQVCVVLLFLKYFGFAGVLVAGLYRNLLCKGNLVVHNNKKNLRSL